MRYNKAQAGGYILSGILAVIVGVALLPIFTSLIDDGQKITTNRQEITNTEYNTSFTLDNEKLISGSLVVLNGTGLSTGSREDTLSTTDAIGEYKVENLRLGTIKIINRTGTWNVSYDYKPDTYVNSATGRTVIGNVTLMYAVALIIITLASVGIYLWKKS